MKIKITHFMGDDIAVLYKADGSVMGSYVISDPDEQVDLMNDWDYLETLGDDNTEIEHEYKD